MLRGDPLINYLSTLFSDCSKNIIACYIYAKIELKTIKTWRRVTILKIRIKKSIDEKLATLEKLAGIELQHGKEAIEEALAVANREGEEDREDLDIDKNLRTAHKKNR
jgi:hypothetical protein